MRQLDSWAFRLQRSATARRERKAPGKETTESAPGRYARRSPTDMETEASRLRKELASDMAQLTLLHARVGDTRMGRQHGDRQ